MKFKLMQFSILPRDGALVPAHPKKPARTWIILLALVALAAGAGFVLCGSNQGQSGPNNGELVALDAGKTSCEVLANADLGEVTVYTWSNDLKSIQPIADWPLKMGSDDHTLVLVPQLDASDPPGYCSKFLGRADWLRSGQVLHGWISTVSDGTRRRNFEWNHGWQTGMHLEPICCGASCQSP